MQKFNPVSGFGFGVEHPLRTTEQEIGFSNPLIADDYELVEVIELFLGVIKCV